MAEKKEYRSAIRSRRFIRQAFLELLNSPIPFLKKLIDIANENRELYTILGKTHYRSVYAAFPEVDAKAPVGISSMMDMSRHFKDGDTEGLANMSGALGTSLMSGVPENYADTLAQIAAQTNAVKDDPLASMSGLPILHTIARGIPVWMQLSILGKAYGAMPVGLTNLGNLNSRRWSWEN